MKTVFRTLLVFITSFMIYGISNAQELSPVEYMNSLTDFSQKNLEDTWVYLNLLAHSKDVDALNESRQKQIESVSEYIEKINKIKPYQGDDSFRQAVLRYLNVMHSVLSQDYSKIVDMKQIAEESYDNYEAYILAERRADEKLDESFKQLQRAEKNFAMKYKIILRDVETDLIRKINKASEVMGYQNKIYLIFFKSFKQEAYLLNAYSIGDIGKIEQNRKTLIKFSDEGLKKLSSEKKFDNDDTLLTECRKALSFYKVEAEKSKTYIDFFMKKESFEKMKKSYDSMSSSEKDQAVIDQYNAKVNEMNIATEKLNDTVDELNDERADIVYKWNGVVAEFLDRHVPE